VHILTSYCACGVQWLKLAQSAGYNRLGASLPENWNRAGFQNIVGLWKIRWWTSQKQKTYQLTPVMFYSLFWISWPLKIGLIGSETSIMNYHSMLHNILQERRSHMKIWWRRPWFGCTWSGLVWSGL